MDKILTALGIDPLYILISLIGFVALAYILVNFAFKPILGTLDARQQKIVGDLDEAQSRKDEMVRLQAEYSTRLAQIEDEARDKIQAAVKEANAAKEEILVRAREEATHIVQRGREEVEAERSKALVESRNQIVDLATTMASLTVKETLNASGQVRIIDDVIAGIGKNGSLN